MFFDILLYLHSELILGFILETGEGGDTTALAIIIVLSIVICMLVILQIYAIHQLRSSKSMDLF